MVGGTKGQEEWEEKKKKREKKIQYRLMLRDVKSLFERILEQLHIFLLFYIYIYIPIPIYIFIYIDIVCS